MARLKGIDSLVAGFARRRPMRAGSLIVTVFGDSIAPLGNSIWLGSLIRLLEPFGLNARQIRTAVFRLVKEGWLKAERTGRKSYYGFSAYGLRQYEKAAKRIYAIHRPNWDGQWTLVLPTFVTDRERAELRRDLQWQGFGALAPGLLAHPSADQASLRATIEERRVAGKVVILEARSGELAPPQALTRLVRECWKLDTLAKRYRQFLRTFEPVAAEIERTRDGLDAEQCLQLRTLLIHEYRRILLHDTDLPDALLPEDWPGREASALTAESYTLIHARAADFVSEKVTTQGGHTPNLDAKYGARFGDGDRESRDDAS